VSELLDQAVRNNANWCARISALHGSNGRFGFAVWQNRYPAPRYYPNVVTLRSDCVAAQMDAIAELKHLPSGWGVKDSYHTLELGPLGFRAAIQGRWVHHNDPSGDDTGLEWRRADTALSLALWEAAWGGESHRGHNRIFLPDILEDASITLFGGYAEERLEAGAIVNVAGGVAGLSNVFATDANLARSVVRHGRRLADGLPLVSWQDAGADIDGESLGLLQVWLRED
jgi:hypothetical protein